MSRQGSASGSRQLSRAGSSSSLRSGAALLGLAASAPFAGRESGVPMAMGGGQRDVHQHGDSDEHYVSEIMHRIQTYVFPRRIRLREHFLDFDSLRCGRVTKNQFTRVLDHAHIEVSEREQLALVEHFTENGPRVQRPQDICYDRFCEVIDEVFNTERLEKDPLSPVPTPGSTLQLAFHPKETDDDERMNHVLHRLAMLCKTRGIIFKYIFRDFERSSAPAAVSVNHRRSGKITVSQFRRFFPFRKDFSEDEINLMIQRYHTESGDMHFRALHDDVTECLPSEPPPFPTSEFIKRPDCADWAHDTVDPVEKIQAKIVEKRTRIRDQFLDFDPLRKGFCTVGQLKTVMTVMGIDKEVDKAQFDLLLGRFVREEDGLFCYNEFSKAVDSAFTVPNLEKAPTQTISMPDATSTITARRNRMSVTDARRAKVEDLEEKIRARIRIRRTLMMPTFQDMDSRHNGIVTRNQFSRCMWMLGFELDETAIALLASVYCDRGNHNEFNYLDFCKSVDPADAEQETAMYQINAPFHPYVANKYFDARGRVHANPPPAIGIAA